MKKQKLSPLLVAGVAAAVQFNPGQVLASPPPVPQNTVTFTNETAYNSQSDVTITISPAIPNADELLSISAGSATGSESGNFTLTVDYTGGTPAADQIYSSAAGFSFASTIINKPFTLGEVDGLTFVGTGNDKFTIPVGTIFTFQVTPEPTTFALAGMGAAGMWFAARRRAGKSAQQ